MGMMFDYVDNRTRGGAKNLYVGNKVKQLDANGLKTEFNASDNDELRAAFGSFDTYLNYMTERQQLINDGSYNTNWFDVDKQTTVGSIRDTEDLNRAGMLANRDLGYAAERQAYTEWQNSPENQALMQKYGLDKPMVNQDGDQYAWNGSSYVKTMKVDDHLGVGDYLKVAAAVGASVLLGPQLTAALTPTLGSAGAAAASAGIMNSASQLALTGNLDLKDALTAAATAGLTDVAMNAFNNSGIVDAAATMEGVGAQEQLQAAQNYLDSGVISQGTYDKFINTFNQTQEAINTAQTAGDAIDNTLGVLGVINTANNYIDILEDDKNVVWQDPNISDVLGDVQVQIPDYSQPQDAGGSSAAEQASDDPAEIVDLNADPFPDTTAGGNTPEIVNPDLTIEDLINADLPAIPTDIIDTSTLPPELTGNEQIGNRQAPTQNTPEQWATNKDFIINAVLNGTATASQENWYKKWEAAGKPETQGDMKSATSEVVSNTTTDTSGGDLTFGGLPDAVGTTPDGTDSAETGGNGGGTNTGDGDGDGEDGTNETTALAAAGMFGGLNEFKPFMAGINYQPVQMVDLIQTPQKDYMQELNGLISRSLFGDMVK